MLDCRSHPHVSPPNAYRYSRDRHPLPWLYPCLYHVVYFTDLAGFLADTHPGFLVGCRITVPGLSTSPTGSRQLDLFSTSYRSSQVGRSKVTEEGRALCRTCQSKFTGRDSHDRESDAKKRRHLISGSFFELTDACGAQPKLHRTCRPCVRHRAYLVAR